MKLKRIISTLVVFGLIGGVLFGAFCWTAVRVYVPEGRSLMLRYKGPLVFGARREAKPGHFAKEGEIGVRERLRGPGRHWYFGLWWERKMVDDVVVQPGEVAVVTCKMGDPLPEGQFLVDDELGTVGNKGIMRKVFGPGRYRANPYAYEFKKIKTNIENVGNQMKHSGWVDIPTGYVGVVTYLADNEAEGKKAGIQEDVLPPGLYPVNPREQQIDVVEIGYRESSISVEPLLDPGGNIKHDDSGEPMAIPESGITFPSNDGFNIQLDFTAVWGVMPDQAPQVVRTFGNIEAVEQKVILPQSESICRNNGSKMGAVELLVGDTRQQFQLDTSDAFQTVLKDKNLTLLYGLVRHIYIPQGVRVPIQMGYVAEELKLTREQESKTAKAEADLREAEKTVTLEEERIRVETLKLVATVLAEGDRESKEIAAETEKLVAAIDLQAAELDAKTRVLLGEADANAEKMRQEAQSQKFQLAVEAFGQASAYNKWEFAEGLPESIDLNLFYAGEGTLWTDLKGILPTLPLRKPAAK